MSSDDYFQLTTALNRLRQLKDIVDTLTNPARLVSEVASLVRDFFALFDGVPGDPEAIADMAGACRVMANALARADTDLDQVRRSVPGVWQGDAAQEAVSALQATQSLMEQGMPAMRRAANLLDDYADELRTLITDYAGPGRLPARQETAKRPEVPTRLRGRPRHAGQSSA